MYHLEKGVGNFGHGPIHKFLELMADQWGLIKGGFLMFHSIFTATFPGQIKLLSTFW
jgi:hypothetical protein